MNDPLLRVILWVHPILALATVALAVRQASLGLRGRTTGGAAAGMRRRHRRFGPWLLSLVVVNWLLGLGSIRLDPRDLELAASGRFQVGTGLVGLYGLTALVSRRIDHDARARAVHPWIGAAALLLSGVQVFLGLQLMPF